MGNFSHLELYFQKELFPAFKAEQHSKPISRINLFSIISISVRDSGSVEIRVLGNVWVVVWLIDTHKKMR